jgi:lipopolysaccharide export system protein LptA
MTMAKTRLILFAAAAAVLALPSVGGAQSTPGAAIAGDQPGMWTGRTVEYTPTGVALIGEAEVLQGENRLRADRINMTLSDGALTQAEAVGGVYFVTPDQTMRGDRAVYDIENDTLTVTGDVILNQGRNVATGGRLVYNLRTETARWEGGADGRVQGVFYPRGN